ncbi:MAG TPA: DUF354 domain-containing protein [Gaiellaceae bacterium]|nr:DUF354 domain-containing protein [Gaiellaceae bacterium]
MRVWIDFSNSPHPLLFAPIARELETRGHEIVVTARDNAQTLELARERWPEVAEIGGQSPRGPGSKLVAIGARMIELRRWAKHARPDVALSHNSYAQIAAARSLGVPVVTAMDYEHQPSNHVAFRLADRILLPEALPRADLRRQGAADRKVVVYPGIKEQLYVGDFEFDPQVLERIGVARGDGDVIVVLRAPPARAIYHRLENPTYAAVIDRIGADASVRAVALVRHPEQRDALAELRLPNLVVPDVAVDSRSLMYAADLVVGAGGTMTRESALLGIPTASIFAGRPAAVDAWLEARGLLKIMQPGDSPAFEPRPRDPVPPAELRRRGAATVARFADVVESMRS